VAPTFSVGPHRQVEEGKKNTPVRVKPNWSPAWPHSRSRARNHVRAAIAIVVLVDVNSALAPAPVTMVAPVIGGY
jgi:hypothetical protein